jgi:hypothetical protein
MGIGKRLILGVPTAKTNIDPANASAMVVNYNDFLVVRPILGDI